jgi:hypothetical protein
MVAPAKTDARNARTEYVKGIAQASIWINLGAYCKGNTIPVTKITGSCNTVAHILPLRDETKKTWNNIPITTVLSTVSPIERNTAGNE